LRLVDARFLAFAPAPYTDPYTLTLKGTIPLFSRSRRLLFPFVSFALGSRLGDGSHA
jgi:hypothetical protein